MEFCYIGFSFDYFVSKSILSNFIKLFFFVFLSNSRNLNDTRLKFLVPLSILKIVKIERTYCQPSEQLFLKKVATQQLKLN